MDDPALLLDRVKRQFETTPVHTLLGLSVDFCANGVARVRLAFRKDLEDAEGNLHSGIIALAGETAGALAAASVAPGSLVRVAEFKINYLGSHRSDLIAVGEVMSRRRNLAVCRLEVIQGEDRTVALGLATYTLQTP